MAFPLGMPHVQQHVYAQLPSCVGYTWKGRKDILLSTCKSKGEGGWQEGAETCQSAIVFVGVCASACTVSDLSHTVWMKDLTSITSRR